MKFKTPHSIYLIWLIPLILLVSCKETPEELIVCTDSKSNTHSRLEFNFKDKLFALNALVMRKPITTDKAVPFAISKATSGYGVSSSRPFPGYDPRGGNVCKMVFITMIDPNNSDWKHCREGMDQLEWMGKYNGGKAEAKNPQSDKEMARYREKINKYCPQFEGQLSGVWFSISEQGKSCDRIGVGIDEFTLPLGGIFYTSTPLEALMQGDSTKCTFNADVVDRLEREGYLTKKTE